MRKKLIILLSLTFYWYVCIIILDTRTFYKLKDEFFKVRACKEELSTALGAFLEEHFPLPEKDGTAKKNKMVSIFECVFVLFS